VSWKKGPERWLKHSYKVFYVILMLNYVILPLLNLLFFIIFTIIIGVINNKNNENPNPYKTPFGSYIIFAAII
jgi:hypothetical protein